MASEYGESTSASTDAGSFECNICFDLAQDPIVTLCGHLFCWPCLYKWLHVHAHSPECPVCKALVEEDKLVPLYGRGKAPSDPRSRSNPIPNRPQGHRPQTAPAPDPNHFANPWFTAAGAGAGAGVGVGPGPHPGANRFGNYTFSAAIGGLGGLFPLLNFQVHGFPDAHAYGPAAGFPYGYGNGFHGGLGHGHAHGHPGHGYGPQQQRQMSQGQQADVYLKALFLLVGFLVIATLAWF